VTKRHKGELEQEIKGPETQITISGQDWLWNGLYRIYWKKPGDEYVLENRSGLIDVTGIPPVGSRPPGDCKTAESGSIPKGLSQQQQIQNVENEASLSVVRIQANWLNDEDPETGVGFFINGRWEIVTAAHVVMKEGGLKAAECLTILMFDSKAPQAISEC